MKISIILIGLIALAIVIGCTQPVSNGSLNEPIDDVVVGYIGPLTGDLAAIGQGQQKSNWFSSWRD